MWSYLLRVETAAAEGVLIVAGRGATYPRGGESAAAQTLAGHARQQS